MTMIIDRNRQVQVVAIKRQFRLLGKNFSLIPIWDPRSQRYATGLEILDPETRDRLMKQFFSNVEESRYFINSGLWLDLRDDYDFIRYLLALVSPDIAYTRRDVNTKQHLFYLHDEIAEAEIDSDRIDTIDDALEYVRGLSTDKIRGLAAYLDMNIRELPEKVMIANVKKMAIDSPKLIIAFKEHPDQAALLFVHKLIVYDILHVEPDGIYFKTRFLSSTKSELLEQMKKEEFKGTYNQLYANMMAVENPSSKKAIEVIGVNQNASNDAKKEEEVEYQKQLLAYYKLVGSDYSGEPNLSTINKEIASYTKRKEAVAEFMEKFKNSDVNALKASCSKRQIDENLYSGVEDVEILKQVIVNHIMKK